MKKKKEIKGFIAITLCSLLLNCTLSVYAADYHSKTSYSFFTNQSIAQVGDKIRLVENDLGKYLSDSDQNNVILDTDSIHQMESSQKEEIIRNLDESYQKENRIYLYGDYDQELYDEIKSAIYDNHIPPISYELDDYTGFVGCSIQKQNGTPLLVYFFDEDQNATARIETMVTTSVITAPPEAKIATANSIYETTYNKPIFVCSRSNTQIQYYVDVKKVAESGTKGLWDVTMTTIVTPLGGWRTYSVSQYIHADYNPQSLREYGPDSNTSGNSYKLTAGFSSGGASISMSYDFGMADIEKKIKYLPIERECNWYYAMPAGAEAATNSHIYRSTLRIEGNKRTLDCNAFTSVSLNRAFWTFGWHWSIVPGDTIVHQLPSFMISLSI